MKSLLAVITGASSGIGFELAKQFGQGGHELLIASNSDDIFDAQKDLEELGYNVEAMKVNLATYTGVEHLYQRIVTKGTPLDALAINTEVGLGGRFFETELRDEINIINLNIVSPVHLAKRILPVMQIQGKGKVLFTSSTASQMPSPFEAVYEASKAFLTSFAQSLRNEFKDSGITFTILMPGATNTNFFRRAHMEDTKVGSELKNQNDPAEVAKQGYKALMEGKEALFSESFLTKIQGYALKILPEKARAQIHRKMSGPGSAHH